ncbi:uncharacterized protein LOC113237788 [Hyposmocoma kahamanoa]|uniref:uncharacterized protein LOC113237788 n=1 Tax=Hyposmocoma kahamanoa TaxID=1477025 RepID=UPI000E6D7239|nr:uncharacterized protein LOC113237788 [Hyposmocoma kahamanoa]
MIVSLCLRSIYALLFISVVTRADELEKETIDKVIEDEITHKLGEDLLQSIEKKFQVDLERSVDSVLTKIKLLLQNGTSHIQDKLVELQDALDIMKKEKAELVDECLMKKQNDTAALAEKALHQMVVCGYALIGHDPAQAMRNVIELKNMINTGLKPIYEQRQEIYNLIKICGHDHDSLKKVIKCVISKSPQIKSAMMGVSAKLVDGVVQLTKLMAHGAMHEACLIEVIRTVEEEAFVLVKKVKKCVEKGGVITVDDDPTPSSIQVAEKEYNLGYNATVADWDTKFRASKDNSSSPNEAVKLDVVSGIPLDAVSSKIETGQAKEELNQNVLTEQAKANTGVKQQINAEIKPEVPRGEAPKEEIKEEMKKLLRRMMGKTGKDDNLKLQLLKELAKDHNNNIDGKL